MTKEQAEFLKEATEYEGNQDIDIRDNYSGRGMYGSTTYAVVVDNLPQLLTDAVNYLNNNIAIDEGTGKSFVGGKPVPNLDAFRQDNMGIRSVVIY